MKKLALFFVLSTILISFLVAQDTTAIKKVKTVSITTTYIETEDRAQGDERKIISEVKIDTIEKDTTIFTVNVKPKYWSLGTKFNIVVTQVAFVNWFAGGNNAISGLAENSSFAYFNKGGLSWKNDLYLSYGLQWQQGDKRVFKNSDNINFSSIIGYKASHNWFYSAFAKFQTQFAKGYQNKDDAADAYTSTFLTPAFLTFSIGMEYNTKDKSFQAYASPVALEMTFVRDTSLSAKYSALDKNGNPVHVKYNFGPYAYAKYKKTWGNFSLETRVDVIANLLTIAKKPSIKVDWITFLSYQLTKYFTLSLKTELLYNPDNLFDVLDSDGIVTGAKTRKVQFMEEFRLGFTYSIKSK
jgi:hypothetical protein